MTLGCQQVSTKTSSVLRSFDGCFFNQGSIQLEDQIYLCQEISGKFADTVKSCLVNMYEIYSYDLTEECQDSFRKDILDVSFEIIESQASEIESTKSSELGIKKVKENDISALYSNINYWYGSIVRDLMSLNDNTERDQLTSQISKLESKVWNQVNHAHQSEFSLGNDGTSGDRKSNYSLVVASQAFEKLAHPELVVKFSTIALESLEERIALLTSINDFICLIDKCYVNKLTESKLANEIKILSKLGSNDLGTLKSDDPDLSKFIQSITNNHSKLTDSLLKSSPGFGLTGLGVSSWDQVKAINLEKIPDYLKGWVSFIQTQEFRYEAYQKTGLFSSRPANIIAFDLSKETFNKISSFTKKITDDLDSKIKGIEQVKNNHLSQLIDRLNDQETLRILDLDAKGKQFDFGILSAELDSLKESIIDDSERFSKYLNQITRMKDNDASIFNNEKLKINSQAVLSLSGQNSKFNGTSTNVGDIAVSEGIIASESGAGIVHLQVSGNWSPTCALEKSGMRKGNSPTLVGPEGYQINFSGESAEIVSKSKTKSITNYEDANFSVSLCLSANGEILGNGPSAKACANYTKGQRKESTESESKTDQTSFRNVASFASGLHLPDTPYPNAPAGSLLAVISNSDTKSIESAKSIQVVGRQASIILEQREKLYLVVNDCNEGQESVSQKLNVDVSSSVPASQLAEQFLGAMLNAIKTTESDFSKNALKLFETGYATPGDLNLLKSNLIAELAIEKPENDSVSFNSLMSLYNNWVDQWVNQIERKIEIIRLEQQLTRLAFDLDRLDVRTQFIEKRSSLKDQLIQMTLSNYDLHIIGRHLSKTISYANDIFLPVIHIHFPDLLSNISGEDIDNLRNISIYSDILTLSETFYKVIDQINSEVSSENSYLFTNPQPSIIGMNIPDPIFYEGGIYKDAKSPTAPMALSVGFWGMLEKIAAGDVSKDDSIEFTIKPSDLYRPDLSSDTLNCIDTDVVVDSMVLAFGLVDDEIDSRLSNLRNRHSLTLSVGPVLQQVRNNELSTYELGSFDGRNLGQFKTGLRFYDYDQPNFELFFTDNAPHSGSMQGLPPFTDFSFERINSLSKVIKNSCGASLNCAPLSSIQNVFVLFKVKTTTDFRANSIAACQ